MTDVVRASTAARRAAASRGTRTAADSSTRGTRAPASAPIRTSTSTSRSTSIRSGAPPDSDAYEIGRDFPQIAESVVTSSDDGRFLLATVKNGDGGEQAHYVRPPSGTWIRLAGYTDDVVTGVWGRTTRCICCRERTRRAAESMKIARSNSPSLADATIVVPQVTR
jgi:hypothetical protein